jgi:hypothetical protein
LKFARNFLTGVTQIPQKSHAKAQGSQRKSKISKGLRKSSFLSVAETFLSI